METGNVVSAVSSKITENGMFWMLKKFNHSIASEVVKTLCHVKISSKRIQD